MKVLVACEESQAVTIELRKRGHEAWSCDILPCSGGHPEWHIQGDVIPLLKQKWDMIIAFPPCTYLTRAGACNIPRDPSRIDKGFEAAQFFYEFYNTDCPRIAIENPIPMKRFKLPLPTQTIHPYEYGHQAIKPTCLWLKGLPNLIPTNNIGIRNVERVVRVRKDGSRAICSSWFYQAGKSKPNRSVERSKTFPGIAAAMAEQWTREEFECMQLQMAVVRR